MNNSNILKIVKDLVISEKKQDQSKDFFKFWLLKNDKAIYSEEFIDSLTNFYEGEVKKGFSTEDLKIEVSGSYDYIILKIVNKISQFSFSRSQFISYPNRSYFTKQQLLEADAPLLDLIKSNRSKYLNNKEAASEFLKSGKFYQNNLSAMHFDIETHDYVLSVSFQNEVEEKAKKESEKEKLKKWILENGSELLKMRIKHDQNWIGLAEIEWAIAKVEDFESWNLSDSANDYTVNNASLDQLKQLEDAKNKYPDYDIDIMRSKFVDEDGERSFRTFLRCKVETPTSFETLYKEINDITEDDD